MTTLPAPAEVSASTSVRPRTAGTPSVAQNQGSTDTVGESGGESVERGQTLERLLPRGNVGDRAGTQRTTLIGTVEETAVGAHEAIGICVGQRIEEHRLHDAKDGGVGAEAEGERDDREEGEHGRTQRRTHAEVQVLPKIAQPVASARGAPVGLEQLGALVPNAAEVAQPFECSRTRCVGGHAARDVLTDSLLEVKRELVIDLGPRLGVERAATALVRESVAHGHLAQLGARV